MFRTNNYTSSGYMPITPYYANLVMMIFWSVNGSCGASDSVRFFENSSNNIERTGFSFL